MGREADMANGKPGRPAKYTPEFKDNAVDYVLASGKTRRECAGDLGVPERTLGKWVQARRLSEPDRPPARRRAPCAGRSSASGRRTSS